MRAAEEETRACVVEEKCCCYSAKEAVGNCCIAVESVGGSLVMAVAVKPVAVAMEEHWTAGYEVAMEEASKVAVAVAVENSLGLVGERAGMGESEAAYSATEEAHHIAAEVASHCVADKRSRVVEATPEESSKNNSGKMGKYYLPMVVVYCIEVVAVVTLEKIVVEGDSAAVYSAKEAVGNCCIAVESVGGSSVMAVAVKPEAVAMEEHWSVGFEVGVSSTSVNFNSLLQAIQRTISMCDLLGTCQMSLHVPPITI
jgi:hypothetical protein